MSADRLELSSCTVWLSTRRVERDGATHRLSAREAALLRYLAERTERVVGREELLREVWRYRRGAVTRAVDHAVARLRRKIERDPASPVHVLSEYGEGYRLVLGGPPSHTLVGRAEELQQCLAALHRQVRVVTVVGPGGAGKTTLARAVTAHLARTGRSVWEVAGPFDDDDAWVAALRRAGELPARSDPLRALAQQHRPVVFVDDPGPGAQVAQLVAQTSEVCVLVASRRVLGVLGEHLIRLEGLHASAARALFLERAEAVSPGVGARTHADTLDALVARLDGLPLALELCAARCSLFEPAQLVARLDDPMALLEHPSRGLRATFAVSWNVLEEADRRALMWLSSFEGAFEVAWAEALLGTGGLASLQILRDHSLLSRAVAGRMCLLDTVRAFVRQQARRCGDWSEAVAAHARLMSRLADEAPTQELMAVVSRVADLAVLAAVGPVLLQRLVEEGRQGAAVDLARRLADVVHPEPEAQARLWIVAARVLERVGEVETATRLLTWCMEHASPPRSLRALGRLAWLVALGGDPARARAMAADGLQLARRRAQTAEEAQLISLLAVLCSDVDEARGLAEQAVAALRTGPDRDALALALGDLGVLWSQQGRADRALVLFEEALTLRRSLGHPVAEAGALVRVGSALEALDRFEPAEEMLREGLARLRPLAVIDVEATAVSNLGLLLCATSRRREGRRLLVEGLELYRSAGNRIMGGVGEGNVGVWHLEEERPDAERALPHLEEAVQILATTQVVTGLSWFRAFLGQALVRLGRLDEGLAALREAEAEVREAQAPVSLAHVWTQRARVQVLRGDLADAAQWMERARHTLSTHRASPLWWRRLHGLERELGVMASGS
ncbi:MAG: winged helix-turn-helix domain-containing protein [Myxococcales bacterium]|nr:winged helix-turn-helix domain-containing protein [Myxococcales bacterium]